tara:strand:- start:5025 stop:5345 length:321 start_codon:yes stop_codon:yes gene_type:complete
MAAIKGHDMNTLRIANKDGFRYGETAYIIGHEFGTICISYGNNEQEALDNAVDDNLMDCMKMSDDDYKEYDDNGWHDSFIVLGNASEPFWSEYLWIKTHAEVHPYK